MARLGPFIVGFPVDFRSGGDTTTAAFGKHIQEIERIYGILDSLNADKISGSEFTEKLTQHVNSSNPHPNIKLALSSLTGDIAMSRVTGNLPASRVEGNFSTDKITGLSTLIANTVAKSIPSTGSHSYTGTSGYADFSTGLQIRYGEHAVDKYASEELNETAIRSHDFSKAFTTRCAAVMLTLHYKNSEVTQHENLTAFVHECEKTYFRYHIEVNEGGETSFDNLGIQYIAIGY